MPTITSSKASAPFSASSLPTCGPTNSTRRNVAPGASALSAVITDSPILAVFCSLLSGRRIMTSWLEPKFCTAMSV